MNSEPEKILFIAYQFPPQGGPGVHRSIRFVKHLPESGILPIVLTRDVASVENGHYPVDKSLMEKIPAHIQIIRVPSDEKRKLRTVLMKFRLYGIFWWLFYKKLWEPSVSWSQKAIDPAKKIISENNIRLIYTSSAPFTALELGYALKKQTGVKWIADLRDPWCDAFTWQWPSERHWKMDTEKEKELLNFADKIIVVTQEMKRLLIKKGIGNEYKIEVVYNGFE